MSDLKSITPRQQERRERVLESTRLQVARLGYDGVNMRELAVEADVSTATLYNLYKSKDELILAAVQDLLAGIRDAGQEKPAGLNHLISRFEVTADTIVVNPGYADAMGRMLFTAEPSAPIVHQLVTLLRDQVAVDLEAMQNCGDLAPDVDCDRLARDITSNSWASVLMLMKGYIALHNFREEYLGAIYGTLLPWLNVDLADKLRPETGISR